MSSPPYKHYVITTLHTLSSPPYIHCVITTLHTLSSPPYIHYVITTLHTLCHYHPTYTVSSPPYIHCVTTTLHTLCHHHPSIYPLCYQQTTRIHQHTPSFVKLDQPHHIAHQLHYHPFPPPISSSLSTQPLRHLSVIPPLCPRTYSRVCVICIYIRTAVHGCTSRCTSTSV